jgi:hypothetical protein
MKPKLKPHEFLYEGKLPEEFDALTDWTLGSIKLLLKFAELYHETANAE